MKYIFTILLGLILVEGSYILINYETINWQSFIVGHMFVLGIIFLFAGLSGLIVELLV